MTDPLRVYADLYQQAVECRRRVDAIRHVLRRAVEALDNRPERFRFDGLDGIALPPPLTDAFAAAAEWPTATQIQQVIADWHAIAGRLVDAWEGLWPRDRELLATLTPETAGIPRSPAYSTR